MPEQLQLAIGIDAKPAEAGAKRIVRSLKSIQQAAARVANTGFRKMEQAGKRLGSRLSEIGKKSRNVDGKLKILGAAAAAAFGFAVKKSIDFELSMSRIEGLVGIAAKEVKAFEKPLLAIARATGKGPNELAEALFFVTSAGARGQQALDILAASAKAAAAGLGETKTVADAVTSAVNAYGEANLTASESTDILVATVKEGKAEADSISGALGRVLPIAKQLGVTFDEVGGTVAALTRVGLDANEATTSLRAALSLVNKPGQEAIDTLKEAKLTMQDVRDVIVKDGMLEALLFLEDAFDGNTQKLTKIFPNLRANAGVFSLIGDNAEKSRQIFEGVRDSIGQTDEAFSAFEKTTRADVDKALVDLGISFKTIADELLPATARAFVLLAEGVEGVVGAFKSLGAAIAEAVHGNEDPYIRLLERQNDLTNALDDLQFKTRKVFKGINEQGQAVFDEVKVPVNEFDKMLIAATGINRAGVELSGTYDEQIAQLQAALKAQNALVEATEKEELAKTQVIEKIFVNVKRRGRQGGDTETTPGIRDAELAATAAKDFAALNLEVEQLGQGLAGLQAGGLEGLGLAEDAIAAEKMFRELQGTIQDLTQQDIVDLIRTERALNDELGRTKEIFDELESTVIDTRTPVETLNKELERIAELRAFAQVSGDAEQLEALTRRSALAMMTFEEAVGAVNPDPVAAVKTQLQLLRDQLALISAEDAAFDTLTLGIRQTEAALVDAELAALGLGNLKTIMEEALPVQDRLALGQAKLREIFSDPVDADKLDAALEALEAKLTKTGDITKEFAIQAARNIQTTFADFLFDPFSEGLDGMVFKFAESIKKIAAEILANQLLKSFFSSLTGFGGGIGNFAGAALEGLSGNQFGGPVQKGVPSLINEEGSRKGEVFVPGQDGRIMTAAQAQQAAAPEVNVTVPITNVNDPQEAIAALESAQGQAAIMNTISSNPQTIKRLLS
jgi:TP901 family phage tail tape measure protein